MLACELLAALRKPKPESSEPLQRVVDLCAELPSDRQDRALDVDLERANRLLDQLAAVEMMDE